jgi:hypothetical protein
LRFEVYDIDADSRDLRKHDFLGFAEATLGEIVSSNHGACTKKLLKAPNVIFKGTIICRAEEIVNSRDYFKFNFKLKKLKKGVCFSNKVWFF